MLLAAFVSVPSGIGYLGVFLLVAGETAGALVPGETALIVAGAVAAQGDLSLIVVIAVGAAGAIVGDNLGFVIGQRGIRRLLTTGRRWQRQREWLVREAGAFFTRHGSKAVLLARWIPGLRLVGAWFAGAARMPWRVFFVWNAIGGVAWAASIAAGAYLLGKAASWAFGLIGLGISVALLVVVGAAVGRARLVRASSGGQRASDSPRMKRETANHRKEQSVDADRK